MFDIIAAVADLASFGLATEPWIPQRSDGTSKVQIGGGKARPIVKVTDLATFRTTWPNGEAVVMQGLNGGQSLRVKLQWVIRTKVEKNAKIEDNDLVAAQLSSMLGVTAPTPQVDPIVAEYAQKHGCTIDEAREQIRELLG